MASSSVQATKGAQLESRDVLFNSGPILSLERLKLQTVNLLRRFITGVPAGQWQIP